MNPRIVRAPIGMIAKSIGPEARNSANESLSAVSPVRYRGQPRKHILVVRFTRYDPGCVKTRGAM
jgi:hypothetical protein